jgi:hypothetical protein
MAGFALDIVVAAFYDAGKVGRRNRYRAWI